MTDAYVLFNVYFQFYEHQFCLSLRLDSEILWNFAHTKCRIELVFLLPMDNDLLVIFPWFIGSLNSRAVDDPKRGQHL
ncbi:hypothetical protein VNO80_28172 [Phaseolus coccineus]|uniref:Uncharacterized protein n=1 Tax=Phaseolus coccineus TaxID=3886 RepID=A0AAN9QHV3_PHACN